MGMWGARPKGREAASEQSGTLPADRLNQLMFFVERAAAPARAHVVPDLPSRLLASPRPVEVAGRPVPAGVDPGAAIGLPDPILVEPASATGKRRGLPPGSA